MLSETSVVVATKGSVSTDVSGEAVILNVVSGHYFGLDVVGARVWALVQQPVPVKDIRDALVSEYDVDRAQCERDVVALLQELVAEGLVADAAGDAS
jgi:hypothetical protein